MIIEMDLLEKRLGKEDKVKLEAMKFFVTKLFAKGTPANPYFTLHGPPHIESVCRNLRLIIDNSGARCNEKEYFFLLAAAWFHDTGMIDSDRSIHHVRSQEIVHSLKDDILFKDSDLELRYIGLLCKGHRVVDLRNEEMKEDLCGHYKIRIDFLAGLLRLADELDLDYRRAPKSLRDILFKSEAPNISRIHWLKHYYVKGIDFSQEIDSNRKRYVNIQISTRASTKTAGRVIQEIMKAPLEKELCSLESVLCENGILIRINYKNTIEAMENPSEELIIQTRKMIRKDIHHILREIEASYRKGDFASVYTHAIDYLRDSLSSLSGEFFSDIYSSVRRLNFILPSYLMAEINFLSDMKTYTDTELGDKATAERNGKFAKIFLGDYLDWFSKKIVLQQWNRISDKLDDIEDLIGMRKQQRMAKQITMEMRSILMNLIALKCTEITGIRFYKNDVVDALNSVPNEAALEILVSHGYDVNQVSALVTEFQTMLSEDQGLDEKKSVNYLYRKLKDIIQSYESTIEEVRNDTQT